LTLGAAPSTIFAMRRPRLLALALAVGCTPLRPLGPSDAPAVRDAPPVPAACHALDLSTPGGFAEVADAEPLRLARDAFTVEAWAFLEEYGTACATTLIAKRGSGAVPMDGWTFGIVGSGAGCAGVVGRLSWAQAGGTEPAVTSTMSVPLGRWFHAAYTFQREPSAPAGTGTLYLDGAPVGSSAIAAPSPTNAAVLRIGQDTRVHTYGWLGRIDDVRLSASRRYAAPFTPAPTLIPDGSTLGLWRFDEGAGQVAASAGGSYPATLFDGAGWSDVSGCAR
jgi:hypothetical protein